MFFSQERTGMHFKRFSILKFRTMTTQNDEYGNLLPDEKRLTKWGSILRMTSLDELPELFSIIKGDMSVIGPRPLPSDYDPYYKKKKKKRFEVRGGLIPPGGSLDKNAIVTWDKQLMYESWYAENVSFCTDIKVLFGVLKILLQRNKNDYGRYIRKSLIEERQNNLSKEG